MRKTIILFIVVFLSSISLLSQAYGTDYYVRPSGGSYGSGNGTSYANAWSGFSAINWTSVNSGNGTLYVDGTNTERLAIGASGESGTPVYVKGYSSSASIRGIIISGKSWVTIDGLIVEGYNGSQGNIYVGSNSDDVTIKNCIIRNAVGGSGIVSSDGLEDRLIIDGCTIYNNGTSTSAYSTHGIFFGSPTTVGGSITIRNSEIYGNGWELGYSHGIYLDTGVLDAQIYNNIVHDHSKGYGMRTKSSLHAYNNIVYGNYYTGINFGQNTRTSSVSIHNNVIYSNGISAIGEFSSGASLSATIYNNSTYHNNTTAQGSSWGNEICIIDSLSSISLKYNILNGNGGVPNVYMASQSNGTYDYNLLYGYGAQTNYQGPNGAYVNPQYVSPPSNFQLQSSSPGISMNAGAYATGGVSSPPPPPPSPSPTPTPTPTPSLIPSPPSITGVL